MNDPVERASDEIGPLLRWVTRLPEPVHLELVCAEHTDGPLALEPDVVAVRLGGCLGELPASALLELVASGVRQVVLRADACDRPATVEAVAAHADDLLAACVRTERMVVRATAPDERARPVLDARSLPLARRALVSFSSAAASSGTSSGAGARRGETERERMLDVLRVLSTPPPRPVAAPGAPRPPRPPRDALDRQLAPSAMLTATGCTGCGTCVRTCPVDALRLAGVPTDDGRTSLTLRHVPAACTGCGLCVEACPQHALASAGQHTWADLLTYVPRFLATAVLRGCSRCGVLLPPDESVSLCEVCAFRRANPFGARLPPGMTGSETLPGVDSLSG
ncbi:4Fe-4S dicluster domain-containing protein [Cellulomonas sp. P22]|uniref:4Fe-4S dicluster domain-containing protein n=1 Tax=Cellulomonas sp. P22 TaxID=3373189 RepID=UPI0037AA4205